MGAPHGRYGGGGAFKHSTVFRDTKNVISVGCRVFSVCDAQISQISMYYHVCLSKTPFRPFFEIT